MAGHAVGTRARRRGTGRLTSVAVAVMSIGALLLLAEVAPASAARAGRATRTAPPPVEQGGRVATGDAHTCALTARGGVKCWGSNPWGALGNGTTTNSSVAVDVVGLGSGVRSVSNGWNFTCAVTFAGAAKCWGYNLRGQLGDGTTNNSSVPVTVVGLASGVRAISAGVFHACALTTRGAVKCWGLNHRGQLGDGSTSNSSVPVDVVGLRSGARAVSAGIWHTCAITASGGATCWGQNNAGQVGDGTTTDRFTPVDVRGLTSGVMSIAAGTGGDQIVDATHSCAVVAAPRWRARRGGGVKCWGINSLGQLGDGTTTTRLTPVDVLGLTSGVKAVSTGGGSTCASAVAGGVWCWGINQFGQLGDGTTQNRSAPVRVARLTTPVSDLSAGGYHTCALTGPAIKCWGGDFYGQLGDATTVNHRPFPTDVPGGFYRPECPALVAAPHTGFVLSNGYALGSVARFSADSGYALAGTTFVRCRFDRTWSGPVPTAAGTGVVTVTPNTGLVDGQVVTVSLHGFAATATLGWCQGVIVNGPAGTGACGGPIHSGVADANGAITDPAYTLTRFIFVPTLGRLVDCANPVDACVIGAADAADIPASAKFATLTFAPVP